MDNKRQSNGRSSITGYIKICEALINKKLFFNMNYQNHPFGIKAGGDISNQLMSWKEGIKWLVLFHLE